jgi:malate synthase
MLLKVIAYTPVGTFESSIKPGTPEEVKTLHECFEKTEQFSYLSLENGEKKIYLPKEVIKQTVFVVEVTQEAGDA